MAPNSKKHTKNSRNNNSQNNHHNSNQQDRSGKRCTYCQANTHKTADCFYKERAGQSNHSKGGNLRVSHTNTKNPDDEPRFRFCKFCKDFGHDLRNCNVLPKELKSTGIPNHQNGASEKHFENSSKITKSYVNPFDKEKEQKNPFAILECSHHAQCRGVCGNKYYMAKSRELKRQLEETLGNMQLWLETLVPPEEDPFSMDWEAAPMIEIPQRRGNHRDPMRLWNPRREPVRMLANSVFTNTQPQPQQQQRPSLGIERFLKTQPFGPFERPPVHLGSYSPDHMALDTPLITPAAAPGPGRDHEYGSTSHPTLLSERLV